MSSMLKTPLKTILAVPEWKAPRQSVQAINVTQPRSPILCMAQPINTFVTAFFSFASSSSSFSFPQKEIHHWYSKTEILVLAAQVRNALHFCIVVNQFCYQLKRIRCFSLTEGQWIFDVLLIWIFTAQNNKDSVLVWIIFFKSEEGRSVRKDTALQTGLIQAPGVSFHPSQVPAGWSTCLFNGSQHPL